MEHVLGAEQVVRDLVEGGLLDFLALLLLVEVGLGFETGFEYAQELLLLLRKEGIRLIRIEVQEVSLNLAEADLVVVDLGDALDDESDVWVVVDVHYLQEISKALINPVLLARENGSLVHLVVLDSGLEAYLLHPIRVFIPHCRKVFHLSTIKLSEEGILDAVEEFKPHLLRVLLNLHLL